jgi:hypothetical protein
LNFKRFLQKLVAIVVVGSIIEGFVAPLIIIEGVPALLIDD